MENNLYAIWIFQCAFPFYLLANYLSAIFKLLAFTRITFAARNKIKWVIILVPHKVVSIQRVFHSKLFSASIYAHYYISMVGMDYGFKQDTLLSHMLHIYLTAVSSIGSWRLYLYAFFRTHISYPFICYNICRRLKPIA